MPSKRPRTPEVEVSEDSDSGFIANIYDGEYLIQVQPHENGYQLSLASKTGMGDAAFLRTYGREERFRELLETEFEAIDADAVFEVLEEHFDDEEYRIVNIKKRYVFTPRTQQRALPEFVKSSHCFERFA